MIPELTLSEAEGLLKLDKEQLDNVCQEQPEIFYRVAKMYTDMLNLKDGLKEELEQVEAEIAIQIRSDLEKLNKKVTEAQIKQLVYMSKKRQKVFEQYLQSKQEADTWGVLKDAFLQRANMIKVLADLHGQNYFNSACVSGKKVQEQEYQQLRNKMAHARAGKEV